MILVSVLLVGCAARTDGLPSQVGLQAEGGLAIYANTDDLTVVSPWADLDQEVGDHFVVGAGYKADVISAATVDVVTSATGGFREIRHEGAGHVTADFTETRAALNYYGSRENDTLSHTFSASADRDFLDRQLTVGLAYGLGLYKVGTVYEPVDLWAPKTVNQADVSGAWVLTPRTVLAGGYTLQVLTGELANPYLRVPLFPSDPEQWDKNHAQWVAERHPEQRIRHGLNLTARHALRDDLFLWARWQGYLGTWSMRAHTGEVGAAFEVADGVVLEAVERFHWQSSVSFYRSVYTVNRDYITRDRRLGKLMTNISGLTLRYTNWRFDALLSAQAEWTHYDDFLVFTDGGLAPMPDVWGVIGQAAVVGKF